MSVQSAHYLTCTNRPGRYPESSYPPSPWQSPQGLALLGLISPSEPHQPNSGGSASARPLHPLRQLIKSCMWPARDNPHDHELRSDACWTSFIPPELHLAGASMADRSTNAARSTAPGDSPSWRTMRVLRGLRLRVHASGNRAHARWLVSPPFPFEPVCGSCLEGLGSASPGLAVYRLLGW
jgi:hypothetical protein